MHVLPSIVSNPRRLAALAAYTILDTPPEADFDSIVALARDIIDAPVALISLVAEERQWFKAKTGVDLCETPIEQSICVHALEADGTLVIPDLTVDPRTRNNPIVVGGPMPRFYAGAPLRTPTGDLLGTLCVLDFKPRPQGLTQLQVTALQTLATQVMTTLELRRLLKSRELMAQEATAAAKAESETTARVRAAQEAGHIGTFDIDLLSDIAEVSAETCRIFGLPVALRYPAQQLSALIVQSEIKDREMTEARQAGSSTLELTYRIRRASDGAIRWVWRGGRFVTGKNGKPVRFFGSLQDVTDRKVGELRQSALVLLGDLLRKTDDVNEIISTAAVILGENLEAFRVGYATIDTTGKLYSIETDWTANASPSYAGTYDFRGIEKTIQRLAMGNPVVIDNIAEAKWLEDDANTYAKLGAESQIAVPLLDRKILVGILFVQDNHPRAWSADEQAFTLEVADRVYAAIAKVRAEEEQLLLNEELSHRLKNTLALVQAIVAQTLQKSVAPEILKSFTDRIFALSTAHNILLQKNWVSARIFDVIRDTLVRQFPTERFSMVGPNLNLASQAALSLSLLMHELATNALKYGALSNDDGIVAIEWKIEHMDIPEFSLVWREQGGPSATEPKHTGFGTRLIKSGLTGSRKTELTYGSKGFAATFYAPLSSMIV